MKKIVALSALLLLPVLAHAEHSGLSENGSKADAKASKVQGSGPSPYTECGIGAAIFKDTPWAAATSNAIWDLGSTAVTSAMSSPEMCNAKKVATAKLIIETLAELEKDIAVGGGTYTAALTETMGCPASAHAPMVSGLRAAYGEVVAQEGYASQSKEQRATTMYNTVKSVGNAVAGSCAVSL